MGILELRESLKDYARDAKLNLGSVLSPEGSPGLNEVQVYSIALACAYYTKQPRLIEEMTDESAKRLPVEYIEAAKSAATIMAMNNIYYRFTYIVENKEIVKIPARLRMNVIAKPGIPKLDFELMCLAVSALEGCVACVNIHVEQLTMLGLEGTQSAIRIAAVLNSTGQALFIG